MPDAKLSCGFSAEISNSTFPSLYMDHVAIEQLHVVNGVSQKFDVRLEGNIARQKGASDPMTGFLFVPVNHSDVDHKAVIKEDN